MILVDTCVLIDIAEDEPAWSAWSIKQLAQWSVLGPVVINPMVFSEWSTLFPNVATVEVAMRDLGLTWHEIPRAALFLAAKAHAQYRRRGGPRPMVLPDFVIGAHAAVERWPVLTRDRRRFATYFPTLELVTPS